jgi:hypothetical protein
VQQGLECRARIGQRVAASPERWAGGRQRARHTRVLALGLRCHPVRVVLAASKGAARRHDVVVAEERRAGSPAAQRLQPSPPDRGWVSAWEGRKERRNKRSRCCTSPGAVSQQSLPSILCGLAAIHGRKGAGQRPVTPSIVPSSRRPCAVVSVVVQYPGPRLQQGAPTSSIDCSAHRSPFAVRPAPSLSASVVVFLSLSHVPMSPCFSPAGLPRRTCRPPCPPRAASR